MLHSLGYYIMGHNYRGRYISTGIIIHVRDCPEKFEIFGPSKPIFALRNF